MDSSEIVGHVLRAILMMALLAGPILLGILALGLLLGVLQAATSRFAGGSQEQPSNPMRMVVRRAARSLVADPENAVGPS